MHALVLVASLLITPAVAGPAEVAAAPEVTWVGIDYTQARFISTVDFREPERVVGYYPDEWNKLVVQELRDDLEKGMKRMVRIDTSGMSARNAKTRTDQIVRKDMSEQRSHLSPEILAGLVRQWPSASGEGIGMGIMMEQLLKVDTAACGWVVFYDLGDKELHHAERFCHDAAGIGFRNYWFRPIKTFLKKDMKRVRKSLR